MKQVMNYIGMLQHPAERIDRGATWSDPEVEELLNIWTNENVQAELKEATIKKHIFERIARNLREKGFFRTAEQCREKIKRLKKEYRQAKNNNYRCVRGRATVKFFPRLQAVLDGGRGPPGKTTFYDGADFPPGGDRDGSGVPFSFHNNHHPKASPHSFSECSAEEIKVDVNPAEVDNDSYMHSEPGEPDLELVESTPAPNAHSRSSRPPPLHSSHWRHHPHHHSHSISHPHVAPVHQPITISIPHSHRNNNNSSNNNNNNNNNGVLSRPPPPSIKDEQDDGSEASSSRATSPSPLTPALNSPLSPHLRRKKFKRNRSLSNQGFKETLEFTLDRFLKHQRESEERLFAWEERRIQMEFEAEERWRQEDREMLRQIVSQLQQIPSNSQPSPLSGSQSNSSHDH